MHYFKERDYPDIPSTIPSVLLWASETSWEWQLAPSCMMTDKRLSQQTANHKPPYSHTNTYRQIPPQFSVLSPRVHWASYFPHLSPSGSVYQHKAWSENSYSVCWISKSSVCKERLYWTTCSEGQRECRGTNRLIYRIITVTATSMKAKNNQWRIVCWRCNLEETIFASHTIIIDRSNLI